MKRIVVLSLFFLFSPAPGASEMTFKVFGKEIKKTNLEELKSKIPPVEINLLEGHEENKRVCYRALSLKKVLEWAYGNELSKGEEVLFTCLDGYQPSVPL